MSTADRDVGVDLTSGGQVVGWGSSGSSQFAFPSGVTYTAISAGTYHSVALTSRGQIVAVGQNDKGQLDLPAPPEGRVYTAIAAGGHRTVAIHCPISEGPGTGSLGSLAGLGLPLGSVG